MTISHLSTTLAFLSKLLTKAILSSSFISLRREHSSIMGSIIIGGGKISDESDDWVDNEDGDGEDGDRLRC